VADSSATAHIGKMPKDHAALRVEVKAQEKHPDRFKWEIYRGSEWIERAMLGYPTEQAAHEAGQAALERILSHEALNKSKP
jgi:hypothetical protein